MCSSLIQLEHEKIIILENRSTIKTLKFPCALLLSTVKLRIYLNSLSYLDLHVSPLGINNI